MKNKLMIAAGAAAMTMVGGCSQYGLGGGLGGDTGYGNDGYYDASRYYRSGDYQPRPLDKNDVVYRGSDGRYYCKRDDGTTGLIVGGLAGGVLGNIIAPGGSKTLGTIIGAAGGAIAGQQVDKGDVKCQ
ncbi:glycine zipper 2TM domain-containing protein [Stakelama saccharophila]|uniref:17 kDa surface antigen n=1 Tax=Stakelama saccharophila TaxID=3075605 RepID=A0ABZ0BAT6_9SPHN|nr:glycine zipper 2TM domain-containing protein [Stakelama sp. W311]WNO54394.1 glycine zipper 2TM domain-containing protein [Stakelama sp. W311]